LRLEVSVHAAQMIPLLQSIWRPWLTWKLCWDVLQAKAGQVFEARFEQPVTARADNFDARFFCFTSSTTSAFL